jgi:phytol kinase
MWAVALGDASAAIVGRSIGRHKLTWMGAKSIEGSLACALITIAGALLVARLDVVLSCIAGVAAAAGELPHRPFDDNIRIAMAVGFTVTLSMLA